MFKRLLFVATLFSLPVFAQVAVVPDTPPQQSMLAQLWWNDVLPFLGTVLMSALVWLIKKGMEFFAAKAKAENASATERFLHTNMTRLMIVVNAIVADVNVRLRPKLQSFLTDGKITPEEAAELKAEALSLLKAKLAPDLLVFVRDMGGGLLDNVLSGIVERAVVENKGTVPSTPDKPFPPAA